MSEIITTETVRVCPNCNSNELVKDYVREEVYCNHCGLVLQSAVQYVGLEKVDNVIPYSAPAEARVGVHGRWIYDDEKGKRDSHNITNYRHSIPNYKLMKKGMGKGRSHL